MAKTFIEAYNSQQNEAAGLQKEANKIQWRIALIAFASLIAAFIAAIFSIATFRQISQQTTMAEQESRPWLKIIDATLDDDLPKEPVLSFSAPYGLAPNISPKPLGMVSLRVSLVFQNVGKGVAQDISIQPNIFFEPQTTRTNADAIGDAEQSTCEGSMTKVKMPQVLSLSAVFPEDKPLTASTGVILPYWAESIIRLPGRQGDLLSGVLIECVTYQYPKRYQTRAVFYIMGPKDRFVEAGKNLLACAAIHIETTHDRRRRAATAAKSGCINYQPSPYPLPGNDRQPGRRAMRAGGRAFLVRLRLSSHRRLDDFEDFATVAEAIAFHDRLIDVYQQMRPRSALPRMCSAGPCIPPRCPLSGAVAILNLNNRYVRKVFQHSTFRVDVCR